MQRVWILNDLYVEPPHRNQGIAKALMNRAHEHAIATNEIG
ncbi:MAG: GNAT family N-acetyltransferase [Cyanobacteria bacterium J06631_6]